MINLRPRAHGKENAPTKELHEENGYVQIQDHHGRDGQFDFDRRLPG